MDFEFQVFSSRTDIPKSLKNRGVLIIDNWDDYSFRTQFLLIVFDSNGTDYEIGNLKIGYKGQQQGYAKSSLPTSFKELESNFFSLGQDVSFYSNISDISDISGFSSNDLLQGLRDIVFDLSLIRDIKDENVFNISLLRFVSFNSIENQFKRVLNGGAILTNFDFYYKRFTSDSSADINLSFNIKSESTPPSNIHVLIGRNGVGKTTILNDMIRICLDQKSEYNSKMYKLEKDIFDEKEVILDSTYFSSIVSISFSAFDPFIPPPNRDKSSGTGYSYIGLKNNNQKNDRILKDREELAKDFISAISN